MTTDYVNDGKPHQENASRRHSDRPASPSPDLGGAISRLLIEQPDLDEVSRLVVALLSVPLNARGARVTMGSDGVGMSAVDLRDRIELVRAADALRGGTSAKGIDHDGRVAAIALGSDVAPLGSLATCMSSPMPTTRAMTYLRELSQPLAVYAAGLLHQRPHADGSPEESALLTIDAGSLSARQLQVLSGLREGLTMGQIASRLGFSDSTIRAESLAIYRHLGVHTRDDAVRRAHGAGLLDDPPPLAEGSLTMSA